MPSMTFRGWTFIDESKAEDLDTPRGKAIQARATALMQEWSRIHHKGEQAYFQMLSDRDDPMYNGGYDPRSCDCDEGRDSDPDELCKHDRAALDQVEADEALKKEGQTVRMQLIEGELESLNIRPMRPYEHHNEMESYYRWEEEGRWGHYSA